MEPEEMSHAEGDIPLQLGGRRQFSFLERSVRAVPLGMSSLDIPSVALLPDCHKASSCHTKTYK
ncbi:hypothetical protein Bca4012_072298 [Brassica carinata]